MLRLILGIVVVAILVLSTPVRRVEAKRIDWKKIYKSFLSKHSDDFEWIGYACIDKNTTPELITDDDIYTIKNNKVKKLKYPKGYYGGIDYYWKRSNCFCYMDGDAEDGDLIQFLKITNGKVESIIKFNAGGAWHGEDEQWRVNDLPVTESEYNNELEDTQKKYKGKYGKSKKIKHEDYTRYHYNQKGEQRYNTQTSKVKKVSCRGDTLSIKGSFDQIDGKKHVFKLTSSTEYVGGDMFISKKQFLKSVKTKGLDLYVIQNKGKVTQIGVYG